MPKMNKQLLLKSMEHNQCRHHLPSGWSVCVLSKLSKLWNCVYILSTYILTYLCTYANSVFFIEFYWCSLCKNIKAARHCAVQKSRLSVRETLWTLLPTTTATAIIIIAIILNWNKLIRNNFFCIIFAPVIINLEIIIN